MSPTEHVREIVDRTFRLYGASPSDAVLETLLIRDGNYCGHRFSVNGYNAVWFVEEDQLKFYGRDGQLLRVLDSREHGTNVRKAA